MSSSSDCDYNTDTEAGPSTGVKRKKIKYAQKYKKDWEKELEFAGWIAPSSKSANMALCKSCNKEINISSGKDALTRHSQRQGHIRSSKSLSSQPKISQFGNEKTKFTQQVMEGQ